MEDSQKQQNFIKIQDGDIIDYSGFFYVVSVIQPGLPASGFKYPKVNLKRLTSREQLLIIKVLQKQQNE